jgi:hypothetical protein
MSNPVACCDVPGMVAFVRRIPELTVKNCIGWAMKIISSVAQPGFKAGIVERGNIPFSSGLETGWVAAPWSATRREASET